jgi:hypothetical protein
MQGKKALISNSGQDWKRKKTLAYNCCTNSIWRELFIIKMLSWIGRGAD